MASWRRIAVAAAVSGLAHAIAVGFGRIDLPAPPPERMPLAVRMAEAPAPAALAKTVRMRAHPAQRARAHRASTPRSASAPAPAPAPTPFAPADAESEVMPAGAETAAAPDALPEVVAEPNAPEPPPEPATIAAEEPAPPARTLPRKGRITYDLVYGPDRFPVGRTVQTWEADADRYQLASRSETVGIVDFLRSQQRVYSSRGTVTAAGLRPESFTSGRDRGRGRGLEVARAQFDWSRSVVTLGRSSEERQEKLPPGSQDLLSFVFQLSLDPPAPGRLTRVVTNGSRIEIYELEVLKEESIETPLGVLKTLPIRQVRKGNQESIELWLATEYRYLPVKLRFFDREGEPQGEQIVADIRVVEN
jgi:hypothetical protein